MTEIRNKIYEKYCSSFNKGSSEIFISKYTQKYLHLKYIKVLKEYSRNSNILDIDCSAGVMLDILRSYGFVNTYGIDISEEQISIAKSKNLNVEHCNIFSYLEDSKNKYSIIFAINVIKHFTKEENADLFNLLYNCQEEDGIIIMRTPSGQGLISNNIIYGDLTHNTIFTSSVLLQLTKISNFKQTESTEDGPIIRGIIESLRYIIWESIKASFNLVRRISGAYRIKYWTENIIFYVYKN